MVPPVLNLTRTQNPILVEDGKVAFFFFEGKRVFEVLLEEKELAFLLLFGLGRHLYK